MGDHVWLMTSRQTEPDLVDIVSRCYEMPGKIGSQLIDVWMEDAVDESYARALVGVLIGQFHMNFPVAAGKWC
jgi:hypothetical protein